MFGFAFYAHFPFFTDNSEKGLLNILIVIFSNEHVSLLEHLSRLPQFRKIKIEICLIVVYILYLFESVFCSRHAIVEYCCISICSKQNVTSLAKDLFSE